MRKRESLVDICFYFLTPFPFLPRRQSKTVNWATGQVSRLTFLLPSAFSRMHSGLAFSAWPSPRLAFDDMSIDLSPNLVHPDVMPCYEGGSNASLPCSPANLFHYHCLMNRRSRSRRNQILNYFHPQGEICDKCSTL